MSVGITGLSYLYITLPQTTGKGIRRLPYGLFVAPAAWQWRGTNMTSDMFILSKNNVLNCQTDNVHTTRESSNPCPCCVITYCVCRLWQMYRRQRWVALQHSDHLGRRVQNRWKARARAPCSSVKITCSVRLQIYREASSKSSSVWLLDWEVTISTICVSIST